MRTVLRRGYGLSVAMESIYRNAEETTTPVEGKIEGEIPTWLCGSLFRNGPGTFSLGDSKYKHYFDGMALLHEFNVRNGRVTYRNKFVRSEAYKRNTKANRIITSEFATVRYTDPCKNIFQRLFTWFTSDVMTDNTLITVTPQSDYVYTATETGAMHQVDPETLDTLNGIDLTKLVAVNMATSHYHRDADGTLHNIGQMFKGRPKYSIIRVPPPAEGEKPFAKAEIVGSSWCRWPFDVTYMHSFGMSENYYVLVEQPLCLNVKQILLSKFTGKSYRECLQWYGDAKSVFHIIDKKTGKKVNLGIRVFTDPFFMFHHINTFEENGCLVVDVCAYKDAAIIDELYLDYVRSETRKPFALCIPRRFVLPLTFDKQEPAGHNYVTLRNSSATAVKQEDGRIACTPEDLTEDTGLELPQINYEKYNGKKYRYVYGISGQYGEKLIKLDTETKSTLLWPGEEGIYCSEPVFVPAPGATGEDQGVLLTILYKVCLPTNVTYLLVLDASSMEELGRVKFDVHIPRDIHGIFLPMKTGQS